jgi:hypothetical protein
MRLYSLVGAIAHEDPEYGHFEADEADGSFAFPDDVSDVLVTLAVRGKRLWETEEQRAERMHGLEMARRRDPASVLTAMEENAALVKQLAQLTAQLTAMQLAQAGAAPAAATQVTAEAEVPAPAENSGGDSLAPAKTARSSRVAKTDTAPVG